MKRVLMYFCLYNKDSQKTLSRYLERLQEDDELNFEFCEVIVNESNPILERYSVKKIPTFILLEKVEGKDLFIEVNRTVGTTSKRKILEFIREN